VIYHETNANLSGLSKELKVRTSHKAVKSLFETEPEIFKISPDELYAIALNGMIQCSET